MAILGWLFLKRDPEKYIHEKASPINFFFKFGRIYHHFFKFGIIVLFMVIIFSLYRFLLNTNFVFSLTSAIAASVVLSGGKELLDKAITLDDVLVSIFSTAAGSGFIILLF